MSQRNDLSSMTVSCRNNSVLQVVRIYIDELNKNSHLPCSEAYYLTYTALAGFPIGGISYF
jgi:hypothetical protein